MAYQAPTPTPAPVAPILAPKTGLAGWLERHPHLRDNWGAYAVVTVMALMCSSVIYVVATNPPRTDAPLLNNAAARACSPASVRNATSKDLSKGTFTVACGDGSTKTVTARVK